jgi:hypothetical protein
LVTLRDAQGNDIFPDVVTEPAPLGTSFRFATARIRTRCGAGALDIFIANGRRPETAWPTVPTVSTCQEVLGGTLTHRCSPGEVMRGINPVTFEPLCTSLGTPNCPSGQVMRGWNVDTGTPNCIPIAPPPAIGALAPPIVQPAGSVTPRTEIRLVPVSFTPTHAICSQPTNSYTNSWLNCHCEVVSMIPGSVTFRVSLSNGNHLHPVVCAPNYIIVGKP